MTAHIRRKRAVLFLNCSFSFWVAGGFGIWQIHRSKNGYCLPTSLHEIKVSAAIGKSERRQTIKIPNRYKDAFVIALSDNQKMYYLLLYLYYIYYFSVGFPYILSEFHTFHSEFRERESYFP